MYSHILFDLDGTLTDSGDGIRKSTQIALKHFGIEENDPVKLNRFVGPPLFRSFKTFYGFDDDKADEAVAVYRKYYSEKGIFECEVYPNVNESLKALKDAGKKLYVATSKPEHLARRVVEHFELDKYFDYVGGATTDRSRAGKSEVIEYVLNAVGLRPSDVILIGDTKYDVIGAASHEIKTIGVAYGYGGRDELKEAGACKIIDSMNELIDIL